MSWASTLWTIVGWLGWKQVVISIAVGAAGAIGGVMQSLPVSIALMAAFCVFVAALYLTQIPAFVRLTQEMKPQDRPDPKVWRHLEQMTLMQAACLLANVTPSEDMRVPTGDASGWVHALINSVQSGEIQRIRSRHDDQLHTFSGTYDPHKGTSIARQSLQAFAKKRGLHPTVLTD